MSLAEYRETCLVVVDEISFEDWAQLWSTVRLQQRASLFWIGDTLLAGERLFGENRWTQVLDEQGVDLYRTAMWVCRKIEPARRKTGASYSAHREIASLSPNEQDRWLALVDTNSWTVARLKEEMANQGAKPRRTNGTGNGTYTNGAAPPDPVPPPASEDDYGTTVAAMPALSNSEPGSDVEAIRALIDDLRLYAADPVASKIPALVERINDAMFYSVANAPLESTDDALMLVPDGWRPTIIERDDSSWEARLRKSGQRQVFGLSPDRCCAIVEAVLAARITDIGV